MQGTTGHYSLLSILNWAGENVMELRRVETATRTPQSQAVCI